MAKANWTLSFLRVDVYSTKTGSSIDIFFLVTFVSIYRVATSISDHFPAFILKTVIKILQVTLENP